jgi:hypothetical protein
MLLELHYTLHQTPSTPSCAPKSADQLSLRTRVAQDCLRGVMLHSQVGIVHDIRLQELRLYTDYGRCCRPLFIVDNERKRLTITKDDIRQLQDREVTHFGWNVSRRPWPLTHILISASSASSACSSLLTQHEGCPCGFFIDCHGCFYCTIVECCAVSWTCKWTCNYSAIYARRPRVLLLYNRGILWHILDLQLDLQLQDHLCPPATILDTIGVQCSGFWELSCLLALSHH